MAAVRVGIEMEFMVAFHTNKVEWDDNAKDTRFPDMPHDAWAADPLYRIPIHHVCEALSRCDLPVSTIIFPHPSFNDIVFASAPREDISAADGRVYRVWNRGRAIRNSVHMQFNFWHVSEENYITDKISRQEPEGMPPGYEWIALEISTAILTDQEELQNGLPSLQEAINALQNSTKIWINSDCGLHVHASPLGQDFDEFTTKKILALTYLLEDGLLFKMCHPKRRESYYAKPIRHQSNFANENWRGEQEVERGAVYMDEIQRFREDSASD